MKGVWVPASVDATDPEAKRRAQLVLIAVSIAIGATLLTIPLMMQVGEERAVLAVALVGLLHLINLPLLYFTGRTRLAAHLFMVLLFISIALDYGLEDPLGVLATPSLPVAATALLGMRAGLGWTLIGALWAAYLGPYVLQEGIISARLGLASGIITLVFGVASAVIEYARASATRESIAQRQLRLDIRDRIQKFTEQTFPSMAMVSPDGTEYASEGVREILGYDPVDFASRDLAGYVHPEDIKRVMARIRQVDQGGFKDEARLRHKDGQWRWLEIFGLPIGLEVEADAASSARSENERDGWMFAARDIHDERESRELLLQAQRLEGLGVLAAGLAHDLNNLLSVIMGRAESLPPSPEREQILGTSEQAVGLIGSLRQFGRQRSKLTQPNNTRAVLENLEPMFRSLLGRNIDLVCKLPDRDLWVSVADGQLELVLLNLITNSREALQQKHSGIDEDRGEVTISVEPVRMNESQAELQGLIPGQYVRISVKDNGWGMGEEVKTRAFEPFYSTKPIHEASGLGLAGVYGVCKQAGGMVRIESREGDGTSVALWFPSLELSKSTPDAPHEAGHFENLSCLLVEDEAEVRVVLKRNLELLGWTVETAADGQSALAKLEATGFDLIISDVMMPGIRGTELVRRIRQQHIATPILLVSGYGVDRDLDLEELQNCSFLAKPFRVAELEARLKQMLERVSA